MQRQRRLPVPQRPLARERLLMAAVLAALGLASAAVAQPQPFSEEPTQHRSSRPYRSDAERDEPLRDADGRDGRTADTVGGDAGRGIARDGAGEAVLNAEAEAGPFSFTGGVDFRSQYFFRGYNFVSSGVIAQPYANLGYTIFENDQVKITPHAGVWMDFTEQKSPQPPQQFHEFDAIFGVAVGLGDLTLDFQYVYYGYPGDALGETHEIGVNATYDDGRFWERRGAPVTALNPSMALFYEAKDNNDDDYNTYVALGLEPALHECHVGRVPVKVSFPLVLGGSYDGYYQDDDGHNATLGYWMAGIKASIPLPRSGYAMRWTLDAEVDYVRLLADSAEAANGNDADDVVFRLGLSFR